jgi:hypothetical protein
MKGSLPKETIERVKEFNLEKAEKKLSDTKGNQELIKQYKQKEECDKCDKKCCPNYPDYYKHAGETTYQFCIHCNKVTSHIIDRMGGLICENMIKHNILKGN